MKRASSIETLIRKSRADFADLKKAYEDSLHERVIREDLRSGHQKHFREPPFVS